VSVNFILTKMDGALKVMLCRCVIASASPCLCSAEGDQECLNIVEGHLDREFLFYKTSSHLISSAIE